MSDSIRALGGMKHDMPMDMPMDMPSPPPPAADDDAPCFARGSSAASHFSSTPPSLEHPLGTCLLGSTTACRVTPGTSAAEAFPQ